MMPMRLAVSMAASALMLSARAWGQPYAASDGAWQAPPLPAAAQRVPYNGVMWNERFAPDPVEDRAARDGDEIPPDLIDNPARPLPDELSGPPSTRHTPAPADAAPVTTAPSSLNPSTPSGLEPSPSTLKPSSPPRGPSISPTTPRLTPQPSASKSPAPIGRQTPSPSPFSSVSPSSGSLPPQLSSAAPASSLSPSMTPNATPVVTPRASETASPSASPSATTKPSDSKKETAKPTPTTPLPLSSTPPSGAPATDTVDSSSSSSAPSPTKDANDASPLSETSSGRANSSANTANLDVALMIALAVCGVIAVSAFVLVRRQREPPTYLGTPMEGSTARAGFGCGVTSSAALSPRRSSSSSSTIPSSSIPPLPTAVPVAARTGRVLSVHHDSVLSVSTIPEEDEDCVSVPESNRGPLAQPTQEEVAFVVKPSVASSCGASEYELNVDSFYAVTTGDRCSGDSVGPEASVDEPLAGSVSHFAASSVFSKQEPNFDYELDVLSDHGDGEDDGEPDKSFHSDLDDSFAQRDDSYADSYGRLSGDSAIRDSQDSLFSRRSSTASNSSSSSSALFGERLTDGSL
ncbi:hypothetical protein P43SY_009354 [Pythium insidiosum]|uniref:Uncharacterized protein n=1 Tax=Pythium insidiosum TaxID=114742 RepID=A0AAD5LJC7_PYTIN|nr:hypothetical protein P43SY_009354 [Pythium insidiosum]